MYTVQMQEECGCFKKSEYTNNNSFKTQQDAYNYSIILAELMNEEFCGRHKFYSQRAEAITLLLEWLLMLLMFLGVALVFLVMWVVVLRMIGPLKLLT